MRETRNKKWIEWQVFVYTDCNFQCSFTFMACLLLFFNLLHATNSVSMCCVEWSEEIDCTIWCSSSSSSSLSLFSFYNILLLFHCLFFHTHTGLKAIFNVPTTGVHSCLHLWSSHTEHREFLSHPSIFDEFKYKNHSPTHIQSSTYRNDIVQSTFMAALEICWK